MEGGAPRFVPRLVTVVKPPPLKCVIPEDAQEVSSLLAADEDAKVLAGGQSLIPLLALRLAHPTVLIDITGIPQLKQVVPLPEGALRVGAMVTQTEMSRFPRIDTTHPLVAKTIPQIAHRSIRNRGTVGGSLAHADPAAEWPALAVCLGATIECVGRQGVRRISAKEFFKGYFTTALRPDEFVTGVVLPESAPDTRTGVAEIARRSGDFAMAGAVVSLRMDGDRIGAASIVTFATSSRPSHIPQLEREVEGATIPAAAAIARKHDFDHLDLAEDIHVNAAFRRHLVRVVVSRALQCATTSVSSPDPEE